jgi:hypothetical protein
LVVTNPAMRDARLKSWFSPHIDINYCACENFTKYLNICQCFSCSNLMISCPWFGLDGGYKSVHERCLSRVMIRPPHRYELLCAWKFHQVFKYKPMSLLYTSYIYVQNKWCHAIDLVLLVVTNRSMRGVCLESRFSPHVDINYCAHEKFHRALLIRLLSCISFVWNMMLKLLFILPQLRGS